MECRGSIDVFLVSIANFMVFFAKFGSLNALGTYLVISVWSADVISLCGTPRRACRPFC